MSVTPGLGEGAPNIRIEKVKLDNARTREQFDFGGNVLTCVDASTQGVLMDLSTDANAHDDDIPFGKGASLKAIEFSSIYITNEAQAGEWVKLLITHITGLDYTEAVSEVGVDKFAEEKDTTLESTADQTVSTGNTTKILSADNKREYVDVTNLSANSGDTCRIGGSSNVGSSQGRILDPEETVRLHVTDDIHVHNPSGNSGDIDFALLEVKD